MNRQDLGKRLTVLKTELCEAHEALAMLMADELRNQVETLRNALLDGSSMAAADKHVKVNSVDLSVPIIKTKGLIASLQEERDHLRFMVKYNMEDQA